MTKNMRTVTVNLGTRSYPIHVGEGLLAACGDLLRQVGCGPRVGIITNPTVAGLYLKPLQESLKRSEFQVTSLLVPDGEEHKNLKSIAAIYDRLIGERFERSSCLI